MGQVVLDSFSDRVLIHGVQTGSDFVLRHEQQMAHGADASIVAEPLQPLFPRLGFERGRVYGITGDASMSLLFALVARPTAHGSWCAMVDMPRVGLLSAAEHGVALQRIVCVSSGASRVWPQVVGALVDGIDLVTVVSPVCTSSDARRLTARVRAQGSVLLVVGRHDVFETDAVLASRSLRWSFDTHASSRTVHIASHGRRVHGSHQVTVHLPSQQGGVVAASSNVSMSSDAHV